MLVPMFLIIGVWGGERRVYATLKFFLYHLPGLGPHAGGAFIYLYLGKTAATFDFFRHSMEVPLTLTGTEV